MAARDKRERRNREPDPSRDPALRTVSIDALLVEGSDVPFRQALHDLMAIGHSFDVMTAGFARLIGVSPPQHELLMLIYRANEGAGIGVGELAAEVRLTSAFVATETNKLSAVGLVEKVPDTVDRRRVILRLTELGRSKLAFLSHYQRQVNDVLFGCFDRDEFRTFAGLLRRVVPSSERAGDVATLLTNDYERSQKVALLSPSSRKAAGA